MSGVPPSLADASFDAAGSRARLAIAPEARRRVVPEHVDVKERSLTTEYSAIESREGTIVV